MTIAITIQTATAAVFAADSKLTTRGLVGFDDAGEPQFVNQTYDNATKIVHDIPRRAMAVVAGSATLGTVSVMDYIASTTVPCGVDAENDEAVVREFARSMAKVRAEFWQGLKVGPERWPFTDVVLATAPTYAKSPAVWRLVFTGEEPEIVKVAAPVYLQGSYDGVFALLYGYRSDVIKELGRELKVGDQVVGEEAIYETLRGTRILRPIDKLSLDVMPIQDAVDLAVFLATTEVQMERFLPGEPACGGQIDVMVLKTSPNQEIVWLPGKLLRHPLGGVP